MRAEMRMYVGCYGPHFMDIASALKQFVNVNSKNWQKRNDFIFTSLENGNLH